jgi:hypothetical protein
MQQMCFLPQEFQCKTLCRGACGENYRLGQFAISKTIPTAEKGYQDSAGAQGTTRGKV